jgi:fused signal recognition particle receptor
MSIVSTSQWLILVGGLVVLGALLAVVLLRGRGGARPVSPEATPEPRVGEDAEVPRDTPTRTIEDTALPEAPVETPEPVATRMVRLRQRLSGSQGGLGRTLFGLLSRDRVDAGTWEEIQDTLLLADMGVGPTQDLVERLQARLRVEGGATPDVRVALRDTLIEMVDAGLDRSLRLEKRGSHPAVALMVGVNGTGKTTTTGKLARILVAEDKHVVLGAADTFRAAAADQLQTWGERVGAHVVRGAEGGDPASVAFDAVRVASESGADVALIDTAGRLQNRANLMDELGKVKRAIEKHAPLGEVLLVLDATTGQNGLVQARVFADVVDVTGIVLTKLDGSAKGGIVVAVQNELGVPVKLVGLGEGPDDLAPFDPSEFVDAVLGDLH